MDEQRWPARKEQLAEIFRRRTKDEWCRLLEDEDEVCFAPVLTLQDAPLHPHVAARDCYVEVDGRVQPAPAPRFSRSEVVAPRSGSVSGADTDEVLRELGLTSDEIAHLRVSAAVSAF